MSVRRGAPRQLFVSYKSQDAEVARGVADHLIASGIHVWFAEYEILLVGRERFEEAIAEGIRGSSYGLALTNNRYVGSRYCRSELRQLLDCCGPDRVLEVRIPEEDEPHRVFPELGRSPHRVAEDVETIVSFIGAQTGWKLRPVEEIERSGPQLVRGKCMGLPYYLDARGWDVVEVGGEMLPDGSVKGPVLRRDGRRAVLVNLYAGPEMSEAARRQDRTADDREVYNELLDHLPSHLGRLGAKARGVHLLLHSGLSQMAVTYRMLGYWTRKISIILRHPETSQPGEFVFTFGFKGPFREYCYRAHLMDELALSLNWGRKEVR